MSPWLHLHITCTHCFSALSELKTKRTACTSCSCLLCNSLISTWRLCRPHKAWLAPSLTKPCLQFHFSCSSMYFILILFYFGHVKFSQFFLNFYLSASFCHEILSPSLDFILTFFFFPKYFPLSHSLLWICLCLWEIDPPCSADWPVKPVCISSATVFSRAAMIIFLIHSLVAIHSKC